MVRQILQQKQIELKCEFGDFGIIEISPKEISLLEKNANFMSKNTFDLLVKNIKKDNAISQLPLLIYDGKKDDFVVISGNHRVKASLVAELKTIPCIIWLKEVSQDEILRLQLSHNSIKGKDDKQILKELVEGIKDIESLELTGITEDYLRELPKIENISLEAIDYDPVDMTFIFNRDNVEEIIEVIKDIKINEDSYAVIVGEGYKDFLNLSSEVCKKVGLTNGENIISFNIFIPILAKIAQDKVNNPEKEAGDLCVDGFKQVIFGNNKVAIDEELYKSYKNHFDKWGGGRKCVFVS